MKTLYLTLLCCLLTSVGLAQDFPKNPKPGECYARYSSTNFEYNKHYDTKSLWKVVPCSLNKQYSLEQCQVANNKLEDYKTKLISLGYKIDLNCKVDKSFLKAHNRYLKKIKKSQTKRIKKLE